MSYGRGKCTGTKKERQMRASTKAKYEAMGARVAAKIAATQTQDLLKWKA